MSEKISFKIIDGQIAVGEVLNYRGVVGIFINDCELLDIVADLEKEKWEEPMDYIHQTMNYIIILRMILRIGKRKTVLKFCAVLVGWLNAVRRPYLLKKTNIMFIGRL